MLSLLSLDAINAASLQQEPFSHFTNAGFLRPETIAELSAAFPDIAQTGFHPASEITLAPVFKQLIDELEGQELSQVLSEKFGMDLTRFPRLTTIRKVSAAHEGRIHCDGKSKVMTLLLYMNEGWQAPDGRLRVLRGEHDFEDYALEVSPEMGTVFGFLRADHSWHGHKPFVGERRVVQVAWVKSQADIDRKRSRHKVSKFFKRLFGRGAEDDAYAA